MPITALPSNAVRAIGSSQSLTDSASLVKELVDNAVDGRATNISIEVSANTLDDLRVKDNGHGIAPNDRAMVCTRYCTSKIRDLHDLENIGGRSLGFRGEALASTAEMSKSLAITTRIEGEGTAVELKFNHKGQISGEKRTSHPVGTTVRVEKFLHNLPVRRQAAEKISVKMLAKIKRMLQAYALARPHLRLSLKILKAKDRKGDWTYPKSGAVSTSRLEASFNAASDMFSKKLTSQCQLISSIWSSTGEQIDEAPSEQLGPSANRDEAYTFEAIMAKKGCDGSVLSNVSQYLSIDSRPVSCTRGTLKQIISLYKSALRSTTISETNAKIVDPFLWLNIACPAGSYDANVEPAKDDVLFVNSEELLGSVERWFHSVYGEVRPESPKPSAATISALKPRGIELLFARKEAPVESAPADLHPVVASTVTSPRTASGFSAHTQPYTSPLGTSAFESSAAAPPYQNSDESSGAINHSMKRQPATDRTQAEAPPGLLPNDPFSAHQSSKETSLEPSSDAVPVGGMSGWKGTMYAEDEDEDQEEDLGIHRQGRPRSPGAIDLDEDEHMRDANASNPWAFAKLNAAMRHSDRNKQLLTPGRQTGDVGHSSNPSSDGLPQHVDSPSLAKNLTRIHQARSSPEATYPTPSPFPFPQKARGKRKADDTSVDALPTPATSNKERHKRGALDTWVQKSLGGYDELDDSPNTLQDEQGPPDLPYPRDFVSARSLPSGGTPLSEIPDASQKPRRKPAPRKQQQGNMEKPFISPVNDPNRVWFDIGENPSRKWHQKPRPKNDQQETAAAPPLIPYDDEIEDDGSLTPACAERSLPLMHPDLAITLDYEARKQKAGEAHRKVLREQAAAAKLTSKTPTEAPKHLPHQHTTTSPHKNRQAKAIAALHTSDIPSSATPSSLGAMEETAALEPSDPRAYLLRIQQQGEQAPELLRGKSRRQKTAMLPLESVKEEHYIGDLTLMVEDVNVRDVEGDMKESGAWDHYVRCGEVGEAFGEVGVEGVKRWEGKLMDLVREMYAIDDDEGEGADVHVDLSTILPARAAG